MLGIVLVNYKTIDETISYIKLELVKITTPHKIVIVDVECGDISHARAISDKCDGQVLEDLNFKPDYDKKVYVLPHKDNLGYAKGNNLGAEFLAKHFDIDYFLFTNNDIKVIDDDVVEKLIERARQHADIGAIGPRVIGLDGKVQSPCRYLSIWQRYFLKYGLYPVTRFCYQWLGVDEVIEVNSDCLCYMLNGCFFLVKANAFDQINGFDSKTFLYGEELILAERLLAKGFTEYFMSSVSIIHQHGQSIGKFNSRATKNWIQFSSVSYYYKNYLKVGEISIGLARVSMALYLYCYFPLNKIFKSLLGMIGITKDPSRQLNKQNQRRNDTSSIASREFDYPLVVKMINRLPSVVLRPTFLFYLYQRLKGTKPPCPPPTEFPYAAVLKTQGQIINALEEVERCNLFKTRPLCKNWDALAALSIVLRQTDKDARILDAGAEIYSSLLPWLHSYGYINLLGVNLCFRKSTRRGSILYQPGDITDLDFPDDYFDAITCLSVIEHYVPLDGYFKEMARILKPGGVLITSADYWEKSIDTKGKKAYGGPINIFNRKDIVEALEIAGNHNLDLIQEVDLSCEDALVSWMRLDFTFIYFSLRKRN